MARKLDLTHRRNKSYNKYHLILLFLLSCAATIPSFFYFAVPLIPKSFASRTTNNSSNVNTHDTNISTMNTSTHGDHSQFTNIYESLFPTNTLQSAFNFNVNYFPFEEIDQRMNIDDMYQRSLSLYPGNNGPVLRLMYNKLISSKSCLSVAVVGTSVTCGMNNNYNTKRPGKSMPDYNHRYSDYLHIWLNQIFPCHHNHTVTNICHAATTVEAFMKKHFVRDFENTAYDMIIMERAASSQTRIDDVPTVFKYWELYFRSFLKLQSRPVLINLITTSHRGFFQDAIPGALTQIPLATYYQIPTVSYFDAYLVLVKYHEELTAINDTDSLLKRDDIQTMIGQNPYLDLQYIHTDSLHPNIYGHQFLASLIANYLMKEYTKVREYAAQHHNEETEQWITSHYLYSPAAIANAIPKPLTLVGENAIDVLHVPKRIYVEYIFDERLEVRNDSGGMWLFRWLEEKKQINLLNQKIIKQNGIRNIQNIELFKAWDRADDWKKIAKYANKWRFGFEKHRNLKPGLIYILDPNNRDKRKTQMMNDYQYRVITFLFDFTGVYGDIINETCVILQLEYLKSYGIFGNALLWIDDEENKYHFADNGTDNFDCNGAIDTFIKSNQNYTVINGYWQQKVSLGAIIDLKLMQPLHLNLLQYVHICVMRSRGQAMNGSEYNNVQKFKLLSLSSVYV
eukprot:95165_1